MHRNHSFVKQKPKKKKLEFLRLICLRVNLTFNTETSLRLQERWNGLLFLSLSLSLSDLLCRQLPLCLSSLGLVAGLLLFASLVRISTCRDSLIDMAIQTSSPFSFIFLFLEVLWWRISELALYLVDHRKAKRWIQLEKRYFSQQAKSRPNPRWTVEIAY